MTTMTTMTTKRTSTRVQLDEGLTAIRAQSSALAVAMEGLIAIAQHSELTPRDHVEPVAEMAYELRRALNELHAGEVLR